MNIGAILDSTPEVDSTILLSHVLGKPKEFLFLHPEKNLTNKQLSNLTKLVRRRQKGEPIAYILGYKYFYGLKFKVTRDTLIPRPETEWLVEKVESLVTSRQSLVRTNSRELTTNNYRLTTSILDLGTGSGCIAVTLAKLLQPTTYGLPTITASDVSPAALGVAKQNARMHTARIKFIQSDLLDHIGGKFDVVIANLPYVPAKDYKKLYHNLKFEPKNALTDGTNSFIIYEKFFRQVPAHLNSGAAILLEIDPSAQKRIAGLAKRYLKNMDIKFYKDFRGLVRYAQLA